MLSKDAKKRRLYKTFNSIMILFCFTLLYIYSGCLNFDLLPEKDIHDHILKGLEEGDSIYKLETDDALLQLQVVLVDVLKQYWVPRFLLQFRKQASKETMDILTRPAPGDLDYLNQERRLRCRFMFPTIYQVKGPFNGSLNEQII